MSVLGQAFTACNSPPPHSPLNTALWDIFHFTRQSSRQAVLASGHMPLPALLQEQIPFICMEEDRREYIFLDRVGGGGAAGGVH